MRSKPPRRQIELGVGRVVIAGQDHHRHAGVGQQPPGAVDRGGADLVVVEGVAGQQHDVGAERPRRPQYVAQPGGAVAAMHRRDPVVVDMQIRRMDEEDVARCSVSASSFLNVIPAKAGIHSSAAPEADEWIPAFAGMTNYTVGTDEFRRANAAYQVRSKSMRSVTGRP